MTTSTFSHLYLRFRYLAKFWCGIAVFSRYHVRYCGIRTPLTPPSDRHAKGNPASRAQSLMNPASRVAVRSCCPSRYSVFSQIPHRILVKSRILKIPSRPYIKRLFSPLQNKKGRKGPPDRRLCMLMSIKRRNVKFKSRIKLNHNTLIPQIC